MRKLKIIALLLLAAFVSVIFSACGRIQEEKDDFLIVTSFYPMYVFTKNITEGAENVEVVNMTEAQTGCLHDYQLLPEDIKIVEKADAFIINGGGMEAFMDKLIENVSSLNVITASEGIELINLECSDHYNHKHEHEKVNSHVWTYVPNAIKEVENITNELCMLNPSNEKIYRQNAEKYIIGLNEIHEKFEAFASSARSVKMVVTHEAFDYMADGYGFEIIGSIMSENNSNPSAGELSTLFEKIKNEDIIGIFKEPQYPDGVIKTIARETNVDVFELDPMVTGEEEYINAYENVMLNNLKTIENALKKKSYGD